MKNGNFTHVSENGAWTCKGVDLQAVPNEIYGPLCKLRDYEKLGLNPSDFRGEKYKSEYKYKVIYGHNSENTCEVLCDSVVQAEVIYNLLKTEYVYVTRSSFSWHVLIEE